MPVRQSFECRRSLFLLLVLCGLLRAVMAQAEPVVTETAGMLRVGSESSRLALVLFPGAFVEKSQYLDIAKVIVEESNDDVSVYIAACLGDVANQIEARLYVQKVVKLMEEAGGTDARARIFLAGHSQGGIAVYGLPPSMNLGGLIMLGSYLPRTVVIGQSLADYKKPVLTLGGDRDGLTGLNYIAREALTAEELAAKDPNVVVQKPVILLPGVSHMQFADGSIRAGDLPAELETAKAHQLIARRIVNFMQIHAPESDYTQRLALNAQRKDVAATLQVLNPYRVTKGVEADWCERIQVRSSGLDADAFKQVDFDTKVYRGLIGQAQFILDKAKVSAEGERYRLHLPVFINEIPGPLDVSKDHALSPESMWCKMRTPEALAEETAQQAADVTPPECAELNRWVIEETLSLLTPLAKARLENKYGAVKNWEQTTSTEAGVDLLTYGPFAIKSKAVSTGQNWIAGDFGLKKLKDEIWELKTVHMKTNRDVLIPAFAGAHYCKVISPGRVVEWATLFGLKD